MLLTIQNRLQALIAADSYFAGVTILKEQLGNVVQAYKAAIAKIKFAVVIGSPSGERVSPKPQEAAWRERVIISIAQGTLTDSEHATRNVSDGAERVIQAIALQPLRVDFPASLFHVTGHRAGITEGGEAVQIVEVEVTTPLFLEPEAEP